MSENGWRDGLGRHLGLDAAQRFEIYRSVAASATLRDATYWAEILFSAGIATLGLTLGSPAVIIGAMLISPLMGPILSAGLALAAGDFVLAIRAVMAVTMSSLAAVAFSTALVVLLPFREMTAEIAARTQPNTLDLIVALFSGAVGALAVSKNLRGVATSLPGVAIAVALMPPLCVTGYGIGLLVTVDRVQGLSVLRGGALLFVTNLVAITFASMLVFLALHVDGEDVRERVRSAPDLPDPTVLPPRLARVGSLPARLLMVAVMVAIVFVPLKRSFDALVKEIRARQELNAVQKEALAAWEELFGTTAGGQPRSYIDRFDATEREGRLMLSVRVFTTESVSEGERQAYVQRVARKLGRQSESLDLSLVEIPTSQYRVATGKTDAKPAPPPPTLGQRLTAMAEETRRTAKTIPLPPGVTMLSADVTLAADTPAITLAYLAPEPLSADAGALVARSARERLDLAGADVRFAWLPSRATIGPLPADGALPAPARTALALMAEALKRDATLQVILQTNAAGAERYSGAVAAALQALGTPAARIRTAVSESVAARTVEVSVGVTRAAG
ncbi:MAG TPA: DUF389 domain-containing protein [Thermoanaerobaculia bacterium]